MIKTINFEKKSGNNDVLMTKNKSYSQSREFMAKVLTRQSRFIPNFTITANTNTDSNQIHRLAKKTNNIARECAQISITRPIIFSLLLTQQAKLYTKLIQNMYLLHK